MKQNLRDPPPLSSGVDFLGLFAGTLGAVHKLSHPHMGIQKDDIRSHRGESSQSKDDR